MLYSDANDSYREAPDQPYKEYTSHWLSQQRKMVLPPTTPPQVSASPTFPARLSQARSTPPRLSKAEALALVDKWKRWLLAGSIVTFGIVGALVVGNTVSNASTQVTPASNAPTTSPSDGNFFPQQGGGYNFGNSNPSQPPVSGSHVS